MNVSIITVVVNSFATIPMVATFVGVKMATSVHSGIQITVLIMMNVLWVYLIATSVIICLAGKASDSHDILSFISFTNSCILCPNSTSSWKIRTTSAEANFDSVDDRTPSCSNSLLLHF